MKDVNRGISQINGEISVIGPKDTFIEDVDININLIRKRIKSDKLSVIDKYIGRYTKTKVSILYLDDLVDKKLLKHIINQIDKIDIDGITDSSYLKKNLEVKKELFPTTINTERPDRASMSLLEGRVVILVDNSPYALILPCFFIDFFHTIDDYYQKEVHVSFIRIIRFLSFLIALYTTPLYISVITRNYNLVSLDTLLMLKAGRVMVPFPAFIEAIFLMICFEILRESDIRMSSTSSSSVAILGGLILGDAAVSAGIVSPIMIIVTAISSISAMSFNSIEFVNILRFYKIIFLILSSMLGIYGVLLGTILLIYNLFTTECFGYKYLIPLFPIDKELLKDSLFKSNDDRLYRNKFITKNRCRGHIR